MGKTEVEITERGVFVRKEVGTVPSTTPSAPHQSCFKPAPALGGEGCGGGQEGAGCFIITSPSLEHRCSRLSLASCGIGKEEVGSCTNQTERATFIGRGLSFPACHMTEW